jgi:hypothetical protein
MFRLDLNIDIDGTFLIGNIRLAPGDLMRVFGNPSPGDMYKVTGEYAFTGPNDTRFTLYDWKYGHSVWDKSSHDPIELNIGGDESSYEYLGDFLKWLTEVVR